MEDEQVGRHVGKGGALALPVADEGGMQVMDRLRTKSVFQNLRAASSRVLVEPLNVLPGAQFTDPEHSTLSVTEVLKHALSGTALPARVGF